MMDFKFIGKDEVGGMEVWARFTDCSDNIQWIYRIDGEQLGNIKTTSYRQLMMQAAMFDELSKYLLNNLDTNDSIMSTITSENTFKSATEIESDLTDKLSESDKKALESLRRKMNFINEIDK